MKRLVRTLAVVLLCLIAGSVVISCVTAAASRRSERGTARATLEQRQDPEPREDADDECGESECEVVPEKERW